MLLFCCVSQAIAQTVVNSGTVEQQPAVAPTVLDDLLARYPAGSIRTIDDANRAGEDVHKMHVLIDAQFAEDQRICFPKFFATSCLNDAKERHRVALARVRAIEIEVNKFKRRANVMARDKSLAEKHRKEVAELAGHTEESQASIAASSSEPLQVPSSSSSVKPQVNVDDRVEKHQMEVKKRQAAEAENAKQRTSNIAAYEKKRQESEARQREIAAKKLEKEKAQSGKGASEPK